MKENQLMGIDRFLFSVMINGESYFYILRNKDRIMVWHEKVFLDYKLSFIIKPKFKKSDIQ